MLASQNTFRCYLLGIDYSQLDDSGAGAHAAQRPECLGGSAAHLRFVCVGSYCLLVRTVRSIQYWFPTEVLTLNNIGTT